MKTNITKLYQSLFFKKKIMFKKYEKIIFPIAIAASLCFSIIFQLSLENSIIRLVILTILFKFTFPISNPSIYTEYIKELKETYQQGLKPEEEFLSLETSRRMTVLLIVMLLILSFLDLGISIPESGLKYILSLSSMCFSICILVDFFNEIKRSFMNTANLHLIAKPILDKKLVRSHWTQAYHGIKYSMIIKVLPKVYVFGGTYGPKLVSGSICFINYNRKNHSGRLQPWR